MKLLYKPFGLVVGVIGGRAAAALFNRLWRGLAHENTAPGATDQNSGFHQVIIASAVKGAVFGAVKAASDRAGASGYAYLTGTWPGKQAAKKQKK